MIMNKAILLRNLNLCRNIKSLSIRYLKYSNVPYCNVESSKNLNAGLVTILPVSLRIGPKITYQSFHTSQKCYDESNKSASNIEDEDEDENEEDLTRESSKVRINVISVETSKEYIDSQAYKTTYGDEPVWVKYRRNFKGQFAPKKTRVSCIDENGKLTSGNPCPLCRDEYLVVDFRNVKLLQQFVSPYSDKVLPWSKTNVCQKKQLQVEVAVEKSRMYGLIKFYIPFREYNYNDYYDFQK